MSMVNTSKRDSPIDGLWEVVHVRDEPNRHDASTCATRVDGSIN